VVLIRHQLLAALGDEVDLLAFQVPGDVEGDRFAIAPADAEPGVGRDELEVLPLVDHRHFMLLAQHFLEFIGRGHAAYACAEHYDVSHGVLLPFYGRYQRARRGRTSCGA
jgi:hypothetical protein